jgi:hypothetical protein
MGTEDLVATTESITVLFTDRLGSTDLVSPPTPEASDDVRRKHFSPSAKRRVVETVLIPTRYSQGLAETLR